MQISRIRLSGRTARLRTWQVHNQGAPSSRCASRPSKITTIRAPVCFAQNCSFISSAWSSAIFTSYSCRESFVFCADCGFLRRLDFLSFPWSTISPSTECTSGKLPRSSLSLSQTAQSACTARSGPSPAGNSARRLCPPVAVWQARPGAPLPRGFRSRPSTR